MDWSNIAIALIGAIGGGLLSAPAAAWLTYRKGVSEIKRAERADALTEWKQISADRELEIRRLDGLISGLQKEHLDCLIHQAKSESEIASLQRQVTTLMIGRHEESSGAAWVVATMDGVIRDAGGRVPAMLHYRATELILKPVDILIPADDKAALEAHHKGFQHVKGSGLLRVTAIPGNAVTSDGKLVPCVVSLSQVEWRGEPAVRAELFELAAPIDGNSSR